MILSCVKMVISIRKEKTVSSENFEKNKKSRKQLKKLSALFVARPKEFESPTFRLGGGRSILLSYGRIFYFIAYGGDLGTLSVLFRMWLRYIWFFYRSSMDIWRAVFRNLRRRSFYPPKVHQYYLRQCRTMTAWRLCVQLAYFLSVCKNPT